VPIGDIERSLELKEAANEGGAPEEENPYPWHKPDVRHLERRIAIHVITG